MTMRGQMLNWLKISYKVEIRYQEFSAVRVYYETADISKIGMLLPYMQATGYSVELSTAVRLPSCRKSTIA